ncbi:MAG: prolyl oligopeptidase family serine peptidase [Actinomycetota bacterium]|nr:prolyl oligopeptidase family serine peptidase [Actinomycetota bacterium]
MTSPRATGLEGAAPEIERALALAPVRSFADITPHPGGGAFSFGSRSNGRSGIFLYDLLERVETLITDERVALGYPGSVGGHAWLGGGGGLLYVSIDGTLLHLPLDAPAPLEWGGFGEVSQVVRAPDGDPIALVSEERRVVVVPDPSRPGGAQEVFTPASLPGEDYFVADPAVSATLGLVAFRHWRDTVMPWQESAIVVTDFLGEVVRVYAEQGVMHSQPAFSPDGTRLGFVSSHDGHLRIRVADPLGDSEPLVTGTPGHDYGNVDQGVGQRTWCFDGQGAGVFALRREAGFARLVHHAIGGQDEGLEIAKGFFDAPALVGSRLVGARQGAKTPTRIAAVDVAEIYEDRPTEGFVREKLVAGHRLYAELAPLAEPETHATLTPAFSEMGMGFPAAEVNTRIYRPWRAARGAGAASRGTVVMLHGGPNDQSEVRFNHRITLFNSMGFTVAVPDFRGTTGYGMDFVRALDGGWGLADVADVAFALEELERRGEIARPFVANGGSAGGYLSLRLAQRSSLGLAGAIAVSPVADPVAVDATTHRFERSLHSTLLGPKSSHLQSWLARSPAADPASISCPLLVIQGSEDKVVPAASVQPMVEALLELGRDVDYLLLEGEGHSFRLAGSSERELAATVTFLDRVAPWPAPAEEGELTPPS